METQTSLSFFDIDFDTDNKYHQDRQQQQHIENSHLNSTCYLTFDDCPIFPNDICETILEKDVFFLLIKLLIMLFILIKND